MKSFLYSFVFTVLLVGCGGGGGGSSALSSSTPSNTSTDSVTKTRESRGYYIDDPIVNADYVCGKYRGKTDENGTFLFEEAKSCKLYVASVFLQEVPASKLKDGIVVFENNLTIASFLQSLDTDETSEKIEISDEVKKAIKELDLKRVPSDLDDFIDRLKNKLNNPSIVLTPKTKEVALSHLREVYSKHKHLKNLYLTDKTTDLNKNFDGYSKSEVDEKAKDLFGEDNTTQTITDDDMKALIGNWAGKEDHLRIVLQLRKDGTYRYYSRLGIGKYHNYYRYTRYEGNWSLQKANSQVVLELPNVDAPLILTNNYPNLLSPAGVKLNGGSDIDNTYHMDIDQTQNTVSASFTQSARNYMAGNTSDFKVDYFTMVAPKANSESFWSSAGIRPPGYNYGHKLGLGSDEWNYALNRIENDPSNYTMVITDENWQTMIGKRWNYKKDILKPEKLYKWFEYFKDQMQILGDVNGTVLYVFGGDAPPNWASSIRSDHNNDASTIPAKVIESRFPEVLERDPSNSFAGVFQVMDYLRMKYAPNVKLGYTLKTWGLVTRDIYHEPANGWENSQDVQIMADTLNSFGIQFDFLSFNFHPRTSHTTDEYKSAAKYFGAISKLLNTRDSTIPKLWIWKLSLWNKEQPKFIFTNIDFLVNECNAIGVTLGHGNDLSGKSGFSDDTQNGIYVKSWIEEYFLDKEIDSIPIHATKGKVLWR